MLLFDALFVNNSGGRVLLDRLVREIYNSGINTFFLLDSRCVGGFDYLDKDRVEFFDASISGRHKFYKTNSKKFDKVFCFGNIPPTYKLNIPVYTYFHNILLIDQPKGYPIKDRLLKIVKGNFIRFISNNTNYFIVQTKHVKQVLIDKWKIKSQNCLVIPFFDIPHTPFSTIEKSNIDFVYISNGNPHKNHLRLLKAWQILASKGYGHLTLHLTITNNYSDLIEKVNELKSTGLNIINHGFVDPTLLYNKCYFSIYPSLTESFGLGLIESSIAGCQIIAANLPYVNSVVKPFETFNPYSIDSLVNAIIKTQKNVIFPEPTSQLKIKNEINELVGLIS